MNRNPAELAREYYTFVGQKNAEEMEKRLHSEAELYGPLFVKRGKKEVFQASKEYLNLFNTLTIRACFGQGEQAVVIVALEIPGMEEPFPGAVLLNFREGLISRIELIYDSRKVMEKKEEIFS